MWILADAELVELPILPSSKKQAFIFRGLTGGISRKQTKKKTNPGARRRGNEAGKSELTNFQIDNN